MARRKRTLCPELAASRMKIVSSERLSFGEGPCPVFLIGEAPGEQEDKVGKPFVGASGEELRHALLINGIVNIGVSLHNVCKWHPPGNRDPLQPEIKACFWEHLLPSLMASSPKWVITAGAVAGKVVAGPNFSIELEHGIARPASYFEERYGISFIHIPVYHPAAGLHNPSKMILFLGDMAAAGDVIKGKIKPQPPMDIYAGKEKYNAAGRL